MELWYKEEHSPNVKFAIKVDRHIYSKTSAFQRIDIMESNEFGKFLTLDSSMMLTEKDEFIYHEMMVHVAMAVNQEAKRILVIGGGDGGAVRELAKYGSIKEIHLVEIDEMVVEACKNWLPQTACRLDDPRVHIYYEDGLRFIRGKADYYDLIIVDSTDPFGPGEGLYTKAFYGNCFKALTDKGILINQHESPYYQVHAESLQRASIHLKSCFPITKFYQAHIPTYPTGYWLFGFASKHYDPIEDFDEKKWNEQGLLTEYYNTDLHKGAFALPNYIKKLI